MKNTISYYNITLKLLYILVLLIFITVNVIIKRRLRIVVKSLVKLIPWISSNIVLVLDFDNNSLLNLLRSI
jgi:hypothetical protein